MIKNIFSLILATYGRVQEVEAFLESLVLCEYDKEYIEVIIVDQNDKINLNKIIDKYKNKLTIKHIKSDIKGLSKNRNIGLEQATGSIIAFPDDDCEYLNKTLNKVNNLFNDFKHDIILGRIIERDGNDSLRIWDKEKKDINTKNFYKKCSSITMFLKKDCAEIKLNEKLGVGEYFGACEDADLIYRNCKKNINIKYLPDIQIYHPHYDSNKNMSEEKIYKYGLGFGAMVKSNLDIDMSILFVKAQGYHFLKMLLSYIKLDFRQGKKSYIAFVSRIKGVMIYKN